MKKAIFKLSLFFTLAIGFSAYFHNIPAYALKKETRNDKYATSVEGEAGNGYNLFLNATLYHKGPPILKGLIWRIFGSSLDKENKLPLLATKKGGEVAFSLPSGTYFINVSFGRLNAQKRIFIQERESYRETFNFAAGALKLEAEIVDGEKTPDNITFSIYSDTTENEDTSLLMANIKPKQIVRLARGSYHILSKYGSVNALKRMEVKIQPGKLTEAMIQHTAAKITMRLVRKEGGEALADTKWAIIDSAGDTVWETVGAYAIFTLEEGPYTIIAKNKEALYQKTISVVSGKDRHIDILTEKPLNTTDYEDSMD